MNRIDINAALRNLKPEDFAALMIRQRRLQKSSRLSRMRVALHNDTIDPLRFSRVGNSIRFLNAHTGSTIFADVRDSEDVEMAKRLLAASLAFEVFAILFALAMVYLPAGTRSALNALDEALVENPSAMDMIRSLANALIEKDIGKILSLINDLLNLPSLTLIVKALFVDVSAWQVAVAVTMFIFGLGQVIYGGPLGWWGKALSILWLVAGLTGKVIQLTQLEGGGSGSAPVPQGGGGGGATGGAGDGQPSDQDAWSDYLEMHAAWEERRRRRRETRPGGIHFGPGFEDDANDPEPQSPPGAEPGDDPEQEPGHRDGGNDETWPGEDGSTMGGVRL